MSAQISHRLVFPLLYGSATQNVLKNCSCGRTLPDGARLVSVAATTGIGRRRAASFI
jgi:hypothetical protein